MATARYLVVLFLAYAAAQTCTTHDNYDYNNGYLVQLYGLADAGHCCTACGTFDECTNWSYDKDPSSGTPWYQSCYIKTSNTSGKANNAITAGDLNRTPPPPYQCQLVEDNTDYNNGWMSLVQNVPNANTCCQLCANYPGCKYWSWIKDPNTGGGWYQRCFFKATNSNKTASSGNTAGAATPIAPAPLRSGKRGVAWFNSGGCSDMKKLGNVSWLYNWGTGPDYTIISCLNQLGIQYIPMQWGLGGLDTLWETIWGNAKYLLGFNEPNFKAQSNVSPLQAAQAWPTMESVAANHSMLLGSPSASACGPNATTDCYAANWSPIPWFDDFFKNCTSLYGSKGCKVDFLTTHIYTCDYNQLESYLMNLTKYNLPIWLTEFACPAAGQDESVELNFMQQALKLLEGNKIFGNYAWFGTRLQPNDDWLGPQVDLLWYNESKLTQLGTTYTTFPPGV